MILSRRLVVALVLLALAAFTTSPGHAQAQTPTIDIDAILNDPRAPVAGNRQGDVTIVAFLDYNCPFCKKATPALDRLLKADPKIRLVYKDWPILAESSVAGALMALAANYQGKYDAVHAALMAIPGGNVSQERMLDAVRATGLDMPRFEADLRNHDADMRALLKSNLAQANALGLEGTPVFLVGPFKVAAALDYDGFRKVVAQARAATRN